ncbi:Bax inhibitor-1/YccA family protein [Shouchella shacheensis]|uniref:Bax inhibitor-1/YccA family protein n=1 Tax=Shouchella shacheensis TaxID=1649580 RepID=UPI000740298F|nr:Bax inhibitor-1/YccA family protein [Shouchella shacheensis]
MRSGNPSLSTHPFRARAASGEKVMTLNGTLHRAMFLLAVTVAVATFAWSTVSEQPELIPVFIWGGIIAGLVMMLASIFAPRIVPFTAPIYVICKGGFIGAFSFRYEAQFDGIVLQAVYVTFAVCAAMLLLYRFKIIRPTPKLRTGIAVATTAIFLVYVVSLIGRFVGFHVPHLHESTPLGIALSVVFVAVASFSLIVDFDDIAKGVRNRSPKLYEWYGAFSLLVTLIWLYIEILRLLRKLRSR